MSAHYDKFSLNTYRATPYFQSQVPKDYPLDLVLQKCRSFRRLPPQLQKLSALAKRCANRVDPQPDIYGINRWYDDNGYELDHNTGKRLTDKEIDDEWDMLESRWGKPDVKVKDTPVPPGGFADLDTWEKPLPKQPERYRPSEKQLLRDIASHGRKRTAEEYGIPVDQLPNSSARAVDDDE